MNVDMEDTLAPGFVYIDAYIVTIGFEFIVHARSRLTQ